MKKKNITSLIFGCLALAFGSIWLGAYIARLLITYQMFEPIELELKSYINSSYLPVVYQTTFPLVNLTFVSYLMLITSFTIFLITVKLKLKENGWLFIVALIIYLTLPFEAVLLTIDYKLVVLFLNEQFSSSDILELIRDRITLLGSFPIILILSYLSIPFFLIVQPFKKKMQNEN